MKKQKLLVDDNCYTVVCAGVRIGSLSRTGALDKARSLNREWADLGFNNGRGRKAEVFYRDGGLVAAFPWPLAESKVYPGEYALACPKCGSTDIMMTIRPGARGTGPGGRARMDDPGNQGVNACVTCEHTSDGGSFMPQWRKLK